MPGSRWNRALRRPLLHRNSRQWENDSVAAVLKGRIREGLPHPRGASWDGKGVNFSLFSANATKVELCIFDASGEQEIERIELPEYTDEIYHGYLPDAHPGLVPVLWRLCRVRAGIPPVGACGRDGVVHDRVRRRPESGAG